MSLDSILDLIVKFLPSLLMVVLVLTLVTNIIVQVLKSVTYGKIPTNFVALGIAMIVSVVGVVAVCIMLKIPVTWYIIGGSVVLGFFVSYAAMFGFDKLKEALKEINKNEKI